nr:Uncharacterised protein [Streptococcus thermophilus]
MGRTKVVATGLAAIMTVGVVAPAQAQAAPVQPDVVVVAQENTGENDKLDWGEGATSLKNELSSGFPNIIGSLISVVGMFGLLLIVLDSFAQLNRWNNQGAAASNGR